MFLPRVTLKSFAPTMSRRIFMKSLRPTPPIKPPETMKVNLTPVEDQIFTLLDECKRHLADRGHDVECRVAGGWVRDKLLGSDSNDIDIALSNMMGVAFAEHFVEFLSSKGLPVNTVSTVARNPEQSKHLETARTTVLDVELDFVNLRSEEYAEDSRIPIEVKFGTPLQDALRRDITINTLFYNVHSRSVEDLTEKGLQDLRDGIIRTPLPPKETFLDDPLRVIRCVRFASRFGFNMVPELEQAVRDEQIQTAVASKISRDRVGEELDKMLKGRDPLRAVQLIDHLNLLPSLFFVPPAVSSTFSSHPASYESSLTATTILHVLTSAPEQLGLPPLHPLLTSQLAVDKSAKPRLSLAAVLTPYQGITYLEKKKKQRPATQAVIREGLRLGVQNHYLDGIPALFASAEMLSNPSLDRYPDPSQRVKIGLLLRDKNLHNANTGSHWTSSFLFSLVQDLVPLWDPSTDVFQETAAAECVETYNSFLRRVEELNLLPAIDAKPLLDGREVVAALNAGKPGPWTGQVLAMITEWQLGHPSGSKDECAAWLKDEHAAGRIVVDGPRPPKREKPGTEDELPKKARIDPCVMYQE